MSEDYPASLTGFRAGSMLAGYRLEAAVGRGGMAVVFRARDERLNRPVALKILAPDLASDSEFRQRFIAESRAAAAVDDPHIIPVYEAGEADGVLYIAMRFVQGGDLRTVLGQEGALPPERAAGFISPVASALDAAHAAGLVHRDVKPGNVLVDARPGRPDHVYLSDFGISKTAAASVHLTLAGHFMGTVDYSAPEQIHGLAVDGRADQYSLACVTYQLLTGAVPFARDNPMAVMMAQVQEPPPPLAARRPDLPGAVDPVLAKAMAKQPERRYASCGDFAEALRDAFGLPPYVARSSPHSLAHPSAQPSQSSESPAPAAAAGPATADAGAADSPGHADPLHTVTIVAGFRERPVTTPEAAAAAFVADPEVDDRPGSAPSPEEPVPDEPAPDGEMSDESSPGAPGTRVDAPGDGLAAVETQDIAAADLGLLPESAPGLPAADSPAGQPRNSIADLPTESAEVLPLASANGSATAPPDPPTASHPAIQSDPVVESDPVVDSDPVVAAIADPVSGAAAADVAESSAEALVTRLDSTVPVAEGEAESLPPPDGPVSAEGTLAPADTAGADVWPVTDLPTAPQAQRPIEGPSQHAKTATARTMRRRLPVLAAAGVILGAAGVIPFMLASSANSPNPGKSAGPTSSPRPASSPRPSSLPSFSRAALSIPAAYSGGSGQISSLAFSPTGGTLAIADSDGICMWDIAASRCAAGFASAWSVAFSPDGKVLATGDVNGSGASNQTIRLWDVATGSQTPSLINPASQGAYSVAFSRDGKVLAAGDANGSIYLWNLATRSRLAPFTDPHSQGVNSVAFTRDEKVLAAGDANGSIYLWDLVTHKPITALSPPGSKGVSSVAFSPDGKILAAGDASGNIYLWDVAARRQLAPLAGGGYSVVFSPDGKTLAAGAANGNVYAWNVITGKRIATLQDPGSGGVNSVVFSPDGKTLATGDEHGGVILWRESSG